MALDELEAAAAEQSNLHRTAAQGLREVQLACAADVPGRLAALAAQRIRELVDPDAGPHQLSGWPTAPDLTPLERAVLAFTEQFVIDVNGITDGLVAPLTAALTRTEVYLLSRVVQAAEARLRAGLVMRYDPELADLAAELQTPVGAR